MSQIHTKEEAEAYLDLFRTHHNKYLIGIYQPGITFYKQQVRALNIFYCLHLTERINKDTIIAVIGGGVAGITFAAAAAKSKIETHIFEKYGEYIPLQQRCRGRELHPHIYDWPLPGSTTESAELPIMNWQRGSVEQFCKTILKELDDIKESFHEDGSSHVNYLKEYFNCDRVESVEFNEEKKNYNIKILVPGKTKKAKMKLLALTADVVIYAVGYGLENSSYGKSTPSYWRDLDTHQPNVAGHKYFISGTGDGALMDLFVLTIKDFSYDHLIKTLDSRHSKHIIDELQKLKRDFFKAPRKANFLYKEFERILGACPDFESTVKFTETEVVLHGEESFDKCLNLDKVSMLNSFFAYFLYKKKKFEFTTGKLKYDPATSALSVEGDDENYNSYYPFFRHGTDRKALLRTIPGLFEEYMALDLEKKQKASLPTGMIERKWENDDLHRIFRRAHYDEIEKVSANALPILECYIQMLYQSFIDLLKIEGKFRIALHKVEIKSDVPYFVQVTPYVSTEHYTFKAGYSRLFPAMGNVGYSIHTRKPSLVAMTNPASTDEFVKFLTEELVLAHAGRKISTRKAFFTMPILAPPAGPAEPGTDQYLPNLVLYIDADQASFFSNKKVFETIISATCGLIKAFESVSEKQQFKMDEVVYNSEMITDSGFGSLTKSAFFRDNDRYFKDFMMEWNLLVAKKKITFKKFHSFTSTTQKQ